MLWCLGLVLAANGLLFWSLARDASHGHLAVGALVVFAQTAVGASAIAFGGINWSLDGAAAPVAAVLRLQEATGPAGALDLSQYDPSGSATPDGRPQHEIRFRDVRFAYPITDQPVLDGFDLTIPAGSSLAIVGLNGAGKTTLAKLLCRLYDPQAGAIEIDGIDMRAFDVDDVFTGGRVEPR